MEQSDRETVAALISSTGITPSRQEMRRIENDYALVRAKAEVLHRADLAGLLDEQPPATERSS